MPIFTEQLKMDGRITVAANIINMVLHHNMLITFAGEVYVWFRYWLWSTIDYKQTQYRGINELFARTNKMDYIYLYNDLNAVGINGSIIKYRDE